MDVLKTGKNLIDILIVTGIILLLLRWILHNSRALQILRGAILVIALKIIADFLGLRTTSEMLNSVLIWGPLIFIILLQPEIRTGLERLADTRSYVTGKKVDNTNSRLIAEIAFELARDYEGATFVIERKTILNKYAETGILIDGIVTKELIRNVFDKTSNMHDGAVLIRNGRINSVGVILPLSQNHDLNYMYGTRHRSAIGISEETDAIVIVVSEERGEVSFVMNGQIETISNIVALRSKLNEEMS
ncbi:MAG: diadenylate cyclase CdaA [Culicoidibacterales bacterium]